MAPCAQFNCLSLPVFRKIFNYIYIYSVLIILFAYIQF